MTERVYVGLAVPPSSALAETEKCVWSRLADEQELAAIALVDGREVGMVRKMVLTC